MIEGLEESILNCLEGETFLTFSEIFQKTRKAMAKASGDGSKVTFSENTLRNYLKGLAEQGKIKHQTEGYTIDRQWKEGTPKAFILIELAHQKHRDNYQIMLANEIRDSFPRGVHQGLSLISVDIVMGAQFSLIVQVYSDDLYCIGQFVKGYLLTHDLVTKTQTIMVWPTRPKSPPVSPLPS